MLKKIMKISFCFAFLIIQNRVVFAGSSQETWGYEGKRGPQSWGTIEEKNSACNEGHKQSPIDLRRKKSPQLFERYIPLEYPKASYELLNNGHTVQANSLGGSYAWLDGRKFNLLQFHFHSPSEHTVDGQSFDLEIHFVHQNEVGDLGVLGVFFKEGKENEALSHFLEKAPKKPGVKSTLAPNFDIHDLLPKNRSFWKYSGSLTTPPCSQIVDWFVYEEAVEISKAQMDKFKKLYSGNNRPVQSIGDRKVLFCTGNES